VILEAWGPDFPSCCEEAVAALVDTFVAVRQDGVVGEHRAHVPAGTPESQLEDVLEEVIFTLDTAEHVPVSAEVRSQTDGSLDVALALADRATVQGTGAVPKAVSRSGLRIERSAGQVRCRFLVDL
jgi:SHS2 domain-containing protein